MEWAPDELEAQEGPRLRATSRLYMFARKEVRLTASSLALVAFLGK